MTTPTTITELIMLFKATKTILSERPKTISPEEWKTYLDRVAALIAGDYKTPQQKFESNLIKTPVGGEARFRRRC